MVKASGLGGKSPNARLSLEARFGLKSPLEVNRYVLRTNSHKLELERRAFIPG
jgi:hypothetical protein